VDPQYQPYVLNNYGTTLHSTYYNEWMIPLHFACAWTLWHVCVVCVLCVCVPAFIPVACNAYKGIDIEHRQLGMIELTKALKIVESLGSLPE
jgi:hypothetical protein